MDTHEIEEKLLQKKREGASFTEIRKELEDVDLPEDKINKIIRSIDERIQEEHLNRGRKLSLSNYGLFYVGLALLVGGLIIILGKYAGLIDTGNSYLITYGPFLVGFTIVYLSKRRSIIDRINKRK